MNGKVEASEMLDTRGRLCTERSRAKNGAAVNVGTRNEAVRVLVVLGVELARAGEGRREGCCHAI